MSCLLTSLLWYGDGEVCRIWVVKKYEKPSLSNPGLICGYCDNLDCDEDDTMDVVDRVSLSCQGVDEHPCAGRHSRLGNLEN